MRARRDTRPYHGIGFDKETIEGDFLDEFAVIHCMVVQDCRSYGDEAIELGNLRYKPIGTRKAMKQKRLSLAAHRKSSPNHPLHRRHYLAPAFCAVEDNGAAKL